MVAMVLCSGDSRERQSWPPPRAGKPTEPEGRNITPPTSDPGGRVAPLSAAVTISPGGFAPVKQSESTRKLIPGGSVFQEVRGARELSPLARILHASAVPGIWRKSSQTGRRADTASFLPWPRASMDMIIALFRAQASDECFQAGIISKAINAISVKVTSSSARVNPSRAGGIRIGRFGTAAQSGGMSRTGRQKSLGNPPCFR